MYSAANFNDLLIVVHFVEDMQEGQLCNEGLISSNFVEDIKKGSCAEVIILYDNVMLLEIPRV